MAKSNDCSERLTTAAVPGHKVSLAVYPFLALIYVYRFTLSPLVGGNCRYYPTCSHYAEEALKKHGVRTGLLMALRRLLRCHPWGSGGVDPVP